MALRIWARAWRWSCPLPWTSDVVWEIPRILMWVSMRAGGDHNVSSVLVKLSVEHRYHRRRGQPSHRSADTSLFNSTHFENASKNTSSILFPLLNRGRGPIKSAQIVSKGSLICLVHILPAGLFWPTLYRCHVSHLQTYLATSRKSPGQ